MNKTFILVIIIASILLLFNKESFRRRRRSNIPYIPTNKSYQVHSLQNIYQVVKNSTLPQSQIKESLEEVTELHKQFERKKSNGKSISRWLNRPKNKNKRKLFWDYYNAGIIYEIGPNATLGNTDLSSIIRLSNLNDTINDSQN